MDGNGFNLEERAIRAMEQEGFVPCFSKAIDAEVERLRGYLPSKAAHAKDLTDWFWSSVDNADSRDLDQVEFAEVGPCGSIRLRIGVADVASFVQRGCAIDNRAWKNTTSVYTGVSTFHLLPEALSTAKTSLLQGEKRLAVVVEMLVQEDGEVEYPEVYWAWVKNHARLTYEQAGAFLGNNLDADIEPGSKLSTQLLLQMEASRRLTALRKRVGALTFSSYEAQVKRRNGEVQLKLIERNRARDMIESFMVAANVATATWLKSNGWPILERLVRAPRRWDRLQEIARRFGFELPDEPHPKPLSEFLEKRRKEAPESFRDLSLSVVKLLGPGEYVVEYPEGPQDSHFGLAVEDYSHSTAPNRRFSDLVLQRLLLAKLENLPVPYGPDELREIASHCTEREDRARKVERHMRKVAAASLIADRVGEVFAGWVTGASPKGTYVRICDPPVEGRVVRGEKGMDVGDQVQVKLVGVNREMGFIDFVGFQAE